MERQTKTMGASEAERKAVAEAAAKQYVKTIEKNQLWHKLELEITAGLGAKRKEIQQSIRETLEMEEEWTNPLTGEVVAAKDGFIPFVDSDDERTMELDPIVEELAVAEYETQIDQINLAKDEIAASYERICVCDPYEWHNEETGLTTRTVTAFWLAPDNGIRMSKTTTLYGASGELLEWEKFEFGQPSLHGMAPLRAWLYDNGSQELKMIYNAYAVAILGIPASFDLYLWMQDPVLCRKSSWLPNGWEVKGSIVGQGYVHVTVNEDLIVKGSFKPYERRTNVRVRPQKKTTRHDF